jgi:Uri superfamily endonuclease
MTKKMRKGSYLLFMTFPQPMTTDVGSLGTLRVGKGEYCYAGSAMNGLDQRIGRHLAKEKKVRWHIDRLTTAADAAEAFVSFDKSECALAAIAEECGCAPMFKGFGSSDCGCRTHLFLVDERSKQELLKRSAVLRFSSE